MQNQRNGELDALRFLFIMLIVLLHFDTGIFPLGSIGVEFFFTLSGLLMARHAERLLEGEKRFESKPLECVADETWRFMKGKLRGIYKYYLSAFIFTVIVRNLIVGHKPLIKIMYGLLKSIPTISLTFFAFHGVETNYYIPSTWFLSAMLVAMLVLYPIISRNYRFAVKVVFPVLAIFLLAYEHNTYGTVGAWNEWTGRTYLGILRAGSEIAFGGFLYYVSTELTRNEAFFTACKRPILRTLLTIIKVGCYVVVLLYARQTIFGMKFDISFSLHGLFLCGIGILLSFSGLGWSIPDCKLTRYLGRISVPIFVFHRMLRNTWLSILGTSEVSLKYKLFMVVVCVIGSIVMMYITEYSALGLKKLFYSTRKDALSS